MSMAWKTMLKKQRLHKIIINVFYSTFHKQFKPMYMKGKRLISYIVSASGVAKQYGLIYAKLLQSCKEYGIPIPPSGYWTKIVCGKEVSKAP